MTKTVVSAEWVANSAEDVRVVDVRDAWEYEEIGHIPGAVNVPFEKFRSAEHAAEGGGGGTGMLPDRNEFAGRMARAGLGQKSKVVAYDDHHGVFAARLLVTMELFGHPTGKLHLLDGDFSAWQRDRETTTEQPEIPMATYGISEPKPNPLIGADGVAEAIVDPEAVIVDTREAWEFEESRIPESIRLDWRELVDDESRGLKPEAELEEILESRGITPEDRVVLYCNTARRISHTYIVLRHLGYPHVEFYEGSLTEWEAQGRPVETGPPE